MILKILRVCCRLRACAWRTPSLHLARTHNLPACFVVRTGSGWVSRPPPAPVVPDMRRARPTCAAEVRVTRTQFNACFTESLLKVKTLTVWTEETFQNTGADSQWGFADLTCLLVNDLTCKHGAAAVVRRRGKMASRTKRRKRFTSARTFPSLPLCTARATDSLVVEASCYSLQGQRSADCHQEAPGGGGGWGVIEEFRG